MPSLIGNKPNQVPTNGDLGDLAFENKVNYNNNKSANTIEVTDNTNAALRITQLGTGNALLVEDSANPDSTPFVIDASGNTVVGYTTPQTVFSGGSSSTPITQVIAGSSTSALAVFNYRNATNINGQPALYFAKSRSDTVGTNTVLSSGDPTGRISFNGADGTNFIESASITAAVDGAPDTGDMPGRLLFSTTADGASSPTERMRITSSGNVGIGLNPTNRNNTRLQIVDGIGFPATQVASSDANTLDDYEEGTFTPTYGGGISNPTVTYNRQAGRYVKIGQFVQVTIEIETNSVSGGSGDLQITGLPFTSLNDRWTGCGVTGYANQFTTQAPRAGYVGINDTYIWLTWQTTATSQDGVPIANLTNGSLKNYLIFTATYRAST
jgi:hypothetical protein